MYEPPCSHPQCPNRALAPGPYCPQHSAERATLTRHQAPLETLHTQVQDLIARRDLLDEWYKDHPDETLAWAKATADITKAIFRMLKQIQDATNANALDTILDELEGNPL